MEEEIKQLIQDRLLQGGSGFSLQIAGSDAVAILEHFYAKGRDDSEREIRAEIAKHEAEEFITKAEAMELLGKSENTLWKWNRSGFLPYTKRGGSIYYKRELVTSILSGNHKK